MLISIVIPVYNTEQMLCTCLDSIVNQTYRQIEIILVDDGSTDGSGEICDRYMRQDNRIKVFHIKNQGLVNARKIGVNAAAGDYVGFVDSDDYIELNAIQAMYQMTENGTVEMVGCGCITDNCGIFGEMGNLADPGIYEGTALERLKGSMMFDIQMGGPSVFQSASCKIFKRDILNKTKELIDNRLTVGEDAAIVYNFLLHANKIVLSDDKFYHYIIRDNSMTRSKDSSVFEKIFLFQNNMKDCFKAYDAKYKLEMQLNRYLLHFLDNGMKNLFGIKYQGIRKMRADSRLYGKKIILYGAGRIGKRYYLQMLEEETTEIVAWVDKKIFGKEIYYRIIQSPEMIKKVSFDYVLIGVGNEEMMLQIREELKEFCEEDKIIWNPGIVKYSGEVEFLNEA